MSKITSLDYARNLDEKDPLASFRHEFHLPKDQNGRDKVYLCGNSLGLQPKRTKSYIEQELSDWATLGVEGHIHAYRPWMPYHEFLTEQMASLVGAKPEEVVVMNGLTVNVHLLMVSFYRPNSKRYKILIEKPAFPSDRYAVISQIRFHGYDPEEALIEVEPLPGENHVRPEVLIDNIDKLGEEIALIWIGNVNYYSGQAFDMASIAEKGHEKGCMVGFDLAHGAGNLSCDLHKSNVDFAAWCGYKYLNSGPGGMSGIFVHERHKYEPEWPRFSGWWGHNKSIRFQMGPEFDLLPGAEGWQLSNPPIFQMASLKASLDVFEEAGMERLVQKREALSQYMIDLLDTIQVGQINIITPRSPAMRGAQVSIRVMDKDRALFQYLSDNGVVADWREPDVIRVAAVPLYNSFEDVWNLYHLINSYYKK
jgi:kynureninase